MANHKNGGRYPFFRGSGCRSSLELSTALEILSATPRQEILRYCASTPEETVAVEPVYQYLHEKTGLAEEDVEIRCHHIHFPKLQKAGLIEYDENERAISYRRDGTIEELLDVIESLSHSPSKYRVS